MTFASGRVTYCRFHVRGDAPKQVDETALSILEQFAFKETEIGAPDEIEAGFITAEHLFDTRFTYEKVGFGSPAQPMLLIALRIDTHRVPSEVKRGYQKQNELAAAQMNPSGFASKAQKRDAKELSSRQLHEDLAAGKFRASKSIPLLWDLSRRMIYCGATGNTVCEQLSRIMREAFTVDLDYLSGGITAAHQLRDVGRGRDYEDLHPTAFTAPPPEVKGYSDEAEGPASDVIHPLVPWVTKGVDLKDFLGNEFLIWLWWQSEAHEGEIEQKGHKLFVAIDKALDMDCAWDVRGKQTLRANGPTRLNEATEALATGKWPRKMGLMFSDGKNQWELSLQGDQMIVSAAKLPDIDHATGPRELVESRLAYIQQLAEVIDGLYAAFLGDRTGAPWPSMRSTIRRWIADRRSTRADTKQQQTHEQEVLN